MDTRARELSEAVVLYLGFGVQPSPRRDERVLVQMFGATRAENLKRYVHSLLAEGQSHS